MRKHLPPAWPCRTSFITKYGYCLNVPAVERHSVTPRQLVLESVVSRQRPATDHPIRRNYCAATVPHAHDAVDSKPQKAEGPSFG